MPRPTALAMDGDLARCALVAAAACALQAHSAPPRCASAVVSYAPGSGAGAAYQQPASALGEPTRFTGTGIEPGAVTPFRPAFLPTDVVSIGRGGQLILAFADAVHDDPRNPHGIDLIVYGNSFCGDLAYPAGIAGFTFAEGGTIDLSADGTTWATVPNAAADGGLPTLGFTDSMPYSTAPGQDPTDVSRPVDPAVTAESIVGLTWEELVAAYGGAAGGTGIDLASVGLSSARFIRIRVATDAPAVPEVDAVVAVQPAPHPADLNGDGAVAGADLGLLLGAWGTCASCTADLDRNGEVNGADLGLLLGAWS